MKAGLRHAQLQLAAIQADSRATSLVAIPSHTLAFPEHDFFSRYDHPFRAQVF